MPRVQYEFEAVGTHWRIDIDDKIPEGDTALLEKIKTRINLFEQTYSRFRTDSLVYQMRQKSGTFVVPDDAEPLLGLYEKLYRITNGAFTPLIGGVLEDAGYDTNYSLKIKELQKPPTWSESISYTHPKLEIKKPVILDFGAAGKGYIIDIIGELLEEEIFSYCVDAGGDIRYRHQGSKSMTIGLENPQNTSQVIGVAAIKNQSICGSAGSRRKWANFHHIINPHTLTSPTNILATWVVADTTLEADAMATCLFFVPPEALLKEYNFEFLNLYDDYHIVKSPNFKVELFT